MRSKIIVSLVIFMICDGDTGCPKHKINEWSPTKCVAGRSFFARFDHIRAVSKTFANKTILQPYVFPWLAEITSDLLQREPCTGTLINDRYVLTAQHCVLPPLRKEQVLVQLGFYNGYEPEVPEILQPRTLERRVLQIIFHPNYDPAERKSSENDLGLLRIKPVKYSSTIYPIQLPNLVDKRKTLVNADAENAHWRYSIMGYQRGTYVAKSFQQLSIKIISNEECNGFSSFYRGSVAAGVLCGVSTGRGSCEPGSGSPLMMEKSERVYNTTVLVGIVSWSAPNRKSCLGLGSPVVYVRIDKKLFWIKENTKDALYCRY